MRQTIQIELMKDHGFALTSARHHLIIREAKATCYGFADAPEMQALMTRAVRHATAPIFFFQAANDYDLSRSKTLSAAMKDASKTYHVKIYPSYGNSAQEGHTLGYFGSSVWADDLFRFLDQSCRH
jgi:hypothetical protein